VSTGVTFGKKMALFLGALIFSGCAPQLHVPARGNNGTSATSQSNTQAVSYATPALVQHKEVSNLASGTNVALVQPVASGHLLIVTISVFSALTDQVTSVVDDVGNSYVSVGTSYGGVYDTEIWYAKNSIPGATQITVTNNGATMTHDIGFLEFSGMDLTAPFDQVNGFGSTPTTNPMPGASISPSISTGVVVSIVVLNNSCTGIHAGNPFQYLPFLGSGNCESYMITSVGGSYQPNWDVTSAGANDNTIIAFFKAAAQ
jgi:hypothetical protein